MEALGCCVFDKWVPPLGQLAVYPLDYFPGDCASLEYAFYPIDLYALTPHLPGRRVSYIIRYIPLFSFGKARGDVVYNTAWGRLLILKYEHFFFTRFDCYKTCKNYCPVFGKQVLA